MPKQNEVLVKQFSKLNVMLNKSVTVLQKLKENEQQTNLMQTHQN